MGMKRARQIAGGWPGGMPGAEESKTSEQTYVATAPPRLSNWARYASSRTDDSSSKLLMPPCPSLPPGVRNTHLPTRLWRAVGAVRRRGRVGGFFFTISRAVGGWVRMPARFVCVGGGVLGGVPGRLRGVAAWTDTQPPASLVQISCKQYWRPAYLCASLVVELLYSWCAQGINM